MTIELWFSILCAFVGDVLAGLGMFSFASQIKGVNPTMATVVAVCAYVGVIAGFFIHACLCIQPVIYKKIMESNQFELADNTLEAYYKLISIPFFVGYIILMVPSICTIIAVLLGYLDVSKWCALLNSIVFLLIGVTLRKIKKEWFNDLPGIIMPSLGLSMIGVIGILNLL